MLSKEAGNFQSVIKAQKGNGQSFLTRSSPSKHCDNRKLYNQPTEILHYTSKPESLYYSRELSSISTRVDNCIIIILKIILPNYETRRLMCMR